MRISALILSLFLTIKSFACGGDYYESMNFYNLFSQENISNKTFYPFLRTNDAVFYGQAYYNEEIVKPFTGNVDLWSEILPKWSKEDIYTALYDSKSTVWKNKTSTIEKEAKAYIDFANKCSNLFSYRNNVNSWDYDVIKKKKPVNAATLIAEAQKLQSSTTNVQLKNRYYYQMIRTFHYTEKWQDAISLYEKELENKLPKDELYYYIIDQIGGCYYSTENYEKAAYLFTKVLNNSQDRKESAYLSYNFCSYQNAEGKKYFTSEEDKKDLQFIKSLRDFSDQNKNLNDFIKLDANDSRIELLFARVLNDIERDIWIKYIGLGNTNSPNFDENSAKENTKALLSICKKQIENSKVSNKDYWKIADSYLSFINGEIALAQSKLSAVKGFPEQKAALEIVYKVYDWDKISDENEKYLYSKIKDAVPLTTSYYYNEVKNDVSNFVLDKVAHQYYKNGDLAKAFLIHNELFEIQEIQSLELIESLISFVNKTNKNDFENLLMQKTLPNAKDYLYNQKGIYYLLKAEPSLAQKAFDLNNAYKIEFFIPKTIFSNNIKECFDCKIDEVMKDEVYKAELFSFIKKDFSAKELTQYILKLEAMRSDETQWKAKLANYLLANYYFNISNTGYFRGILNNSGNCCDYNYMNYYSDNEQKNDEKIAKKQGYNLFDVAYNVNKYNHLADKSMTYYNEVLSLSKDKELNARCLYMMAKCELNSFYNNDEKPTYSIELEYFTLDLPSYSKSFKLLKKDYSDTKFHAMIIEECSYFRMYSNQ